MVDFSKKVKDTREILFREGKKIFDNYKYCTSEKVLGIIQNEKEFYKENDNKEWRKTISELSKKVDFSDEMKDICMRINKLLKSEESPIDFDKLNKDMKKINKEKTLVEEVTEFFEGEVME